MAGIINVIGIVSGILGIFQFGIDNFAKTDSGGSVVRIQVGLDSTGGLTNSGGDLPDIRLFNEVGEFLGAKYDPGHIDDGTTGSDIRVQQKAEQQATYGLFTANDDAICIAYLSIVWPDGQKFGWTGGWGRQCGATWYYSNIVIDDKKPECMWIDKNHDQPITAFQIHFPDFVTEGHDAAFYCSNGPPFALYQNDDPNSIVFTPPLKTKSKRFPAVSGTINPPPRQLEHSDEIVYSSDPRLVISSDANQNTTELCASPASLGPDFANIATRHFCNMSTKTLHPICSATVTDDCFNMDTHKLIVGGISTRDQAYSKVIDWSDPSPPSSSS